MRLPRQHLLASRRHVVRPGRRCRCGDRLDTAAFYADDDGFNGRIFSGRFCLREWPVPASRGADRR
jgi:hypothetical protein